MLINNSDRPLLLLAGEIVTGGKQDRVIGADRLVPPKSDPIDLSVFCVEPGRWVATQRAVRQHEIADGAAQRAHAGDGRERSAAGMGPGGRSEKGCDASSQATEGTAGAPLVQADNADLSADFNQNFVGNASNGGNDLGHAVGGTTSYARTMAIPKVQATIDNVAGNYESIREQLKKDGAKGVVVAINGKLVWADLFASNDLLMRYWQKLVRSYAAESLTPAARKGRSIRKQRRSS